MQCENMEILMKNHALNEKLKQTKKVPYIRAYEHFEDLDVGFFFLYKAITS